MRLPWDKRGTLRLDQMPVFDRSTIKRLSDEELLQFISGWGEQFWQHRLGQMELRRREQSTARWALGISFLSLVVAVVALLVRK